MYKQHLKIKNNKNQSGVFTDIKIPSNMPVFEFTGTIWNNESLPDDQNHDLILQIGSNLYMGPSGDIDDAINHSCNPNCYISIAGKRVILYSLYEIKADTEITFDYSLSSTDSMEEWSFNCNCNQFNCRKIISGFQYLNEEVRNSYIKKNIVPLFIYDKRFK